MNQKYIDKLIKLKRVGKLIKLVKNNEYIWSVANYQYVFDKCIERKLYDIFYFLLEIFNKRHCISFFNNKKYKFYPSHGFVRNILKWSFRKNYFDIIKYLSTDKMKKKYSDLNDYYCGDYWNDDFKYNIKKELTISLQNKNKEIVKYLLSKEIRNIHPHIEADNSRYVCGFSYICKYSNIEMTQYILSPFMININPNIDLSSNHSNCITHNCVNTNFKMLKYLLLPKIQELYPQVNFSENYYHGLKLLCEGKNRAIIKYLLSPDIQKRYVKLRPINMNYQLINLIQKTIKCDIYKFINNYKEKEFKDKYYVFKNEL